MVIKGTDLLTHEEMVALPYGYYNHAPVQIPVIPRKAEVKTPEPKVKVWTLDYELYTGMWFLRALNRALKFMDEGGCTAVVVKNIPGSKQATLPISHTRRISGTTVTFVSNGK